MRKQLFVMGAAAMTLSACGNHNQQANYPPPAQQTTYATVQQCQSDPGNPHPELCQQSFMREQASIPRYSSYDQCSSIYGPSDCTNYGGSFGPMMAGFMLGSMYNGSFYAPPPMYVGPGGYLYSGGRSLGYYPTRTYYGGHYIYAAPHTVIINRDSSGRFAPAPVTASSTTRRGIFGGNQARAGLMATRKITTSTTTSDSIVSASPTGGKTSSTTTSTNYSSSTSRGLFGGGAGRSSGFSSGTSYHSSSFGGGGFHSGGGFS